MKLLELGLLEIADYANTTYDNKLNISGIFDELKVEELPAIHSRLYLVAIVSGEPDSEHSLELFLKTPDKTHVLNSRSIKTKQGENGRANILVEMVDIEFESEGDYIFSLSEGGTRKLGERVLKVSKSDG